MMSHCISAVLHGSASHHLSACSGWSGAAAPGSDDDPGPRLAALPLPKLCPVGFVFVWAEKEHISSVIKQVGPDCTSWLSRLQKPAYGKYFSTAVMCNMSLLTISCHKKESRNFVTDLYTA